MVRAMDRGDLGASATDAVAAPGGGPRHRVLRVTTCRGHQWARAASGRGPTTTPRGFWPRANREGAASI